MEVPEEVDSLRLWTYLIYSYRLMGGDFSGKDPVTDLRCLRSFLVCVLVNETSTYFNRSKLYPHSVIPLYDIIWNSGSIIGWVFSEILLILIISFIEALYRSTRDVKSLGVICSLPFLSGVSILSLFTPSYLILDCKYFSCLALSLGFSFVRRHLILASYSVFPIFAISRAISSRYVALNCMQFFVHSWYSLIAFNFWWRRVLMLRGGHHLLPVMYYRFVTAFSFIFISLSFLCMRRVTRRRRIWASLTVLEY